jgi:hypothetical protein
MKPEGHPMNRTANRWTGGRSAARVGILILGIALAIAPEARAWGGDVLRVVDF